ncbi:sensor domain CHASE2-containing protein [Ekhidna lutea]|uniref:Sensor domain CHASE2-containing protein n=1 Tax=Ekhidna lutea TaxID=447679 RepID=A0A239KBZ6_EKHLU|nr:CHASE2 domain-containing protein [Ekhidna lutea]SNT15926.1 sensor domain CHASE2-containing protein [Ekhidna lutea]
MFRRFWRDVILGTIFIISLMLFIGSVSAFKVFDIFDPIGDAFEDMEFTDIYFSQLLDDPIADENVVLVNIGLESRAGIAMMIDSISQHNPAVIGVDSFFDFPKEDTLGDMMLMDALSRVENLIMVTKVLYNPDTEKLDSVHTSWPWFTFNAEPAFANLITDAQVQEDLKMCRSFNPTLTTTDSTTHTAFAVKLASYLAPEKAQAFIDRGNEEEVINYRGNVIDFGATKFGNKYYALDVGDVFGSNYIPEIIEGKVVIFCFLGEVLGDRENFEDKFFTPLNDVYIGRAFPDMYGGVIHANIVSMILNENYIFYLKDWQKIAVAVLILFLNIMAFSWIYKKLPKWYDGITKVIQLIEFVGIIYLMIYFMDIFSMKLDLTYLLFAVALSGDGLEVFYGVVKNSLSKEGRKELFKVSRL